MAALIAVLVILAIVLVAIGVAVGWALWVLAGVIITGIVVGGLARLIIPGRQKIGILLTIILGWIGSAVGGYLGDQVLETGWLLTVVCEVGIAAVLVGVASAASGKATKA